MTSSTATVGQAIDQILEALKPHEKRQQQTIISTVCQFLDLASSVVPAEKGPDARGNGSAGADSERKTASGNSDEPVKNKREQALDIRTLRQQKQPGSAAQMACVTAYYLAEHAEDSESAGTITTADLEKYFKQAGFPLPRKLEQVLADGRRSGYFDQVSRGEYKLTRVGYNLVAHKLPKSDKAA